MATELTPSTCMTGDLSVTRYWGGTYTGTCVQLTFKKPEHERGKLDYGFWYVQMSKEQARDLAATLAAFAYGE